MPAPIYNEDLANIHVDGYGFHWEQAAPAVLSWLNKAGIAEGLVVDLGCGGGQWLRRLTLEGYATCGIDVSPTMIKLAKKRAPDAEYLCGSFAEVDLPNCDAVTSMGEPLNYLNSGTLMRKTMRRVFAALRPGGLFIFDVRHPPPGKLPDRHYIRSGDDWFCHSLIEEDAKQLVRQITTFRKGRGELYRRDQETHRLKLFSRNQMLTWLRAIGFRVHTRCGYGDYPLTARQSVFICRKP